MIFKQLFDEDSCTYTYFLAKKQGGEAAIIDPVKSKIPDYLDLIKKYNLSLSVAIDTHLHADHITALGGLQDATSCQLIMGEQTKAECLSYKVSDGETIDVGGLKLKAIYTPGHTDDSYSLLLDDKVFTGDTLLIGKTGRTDFQNGSSEQQYDSIFNKLLTLKDSTLVYPAHDYNGNKFSTILKEKQTNPRLQVKSCSEYVKLMNSLNLPMPKHIKVAVPSNIKLGRLN